MKVLIDTNVYVSAFAFGSRSISNLITFVYDHHQIVISDYLASEILRVTSKRNSARVGAALSFLSLPGIEWITLSSDSESTSKVRDPNDQPILDAAISIDADIILTGDKDFLALDIDRPRIMTPRDFISEFMADAE